MFTQEQINEIEQRLALKGSKDTQLPEVELPLKGDETVAIIQEGENRNLPIEIFIKYPIEGAFNVSKYLQLINKEETLVKVSLEDAVTSVPTMAKNEGQTIVFIDSNNTWQCYQYQSDTIDDWDNLLKWKNLNDSSSTPIEEGAHIYNISEYLPGGAKYGQPLYAGVYTIGGTTTPVTQYRFVFGYDDTLGEVSIENKEDTLVILDYDTYDELVVRSYYLFVGNDTEGYYYQTIIDDDEEVPEWISRAFGNTNDSILVNINKLKEEIDRTKISKGRLKTIQGKSIEGTGNIEIDTYINQFASSNNPINWNWGGDGNIVSVDIDNVKGVKASYSEEYTTGNVYSVLDVTLKAKQHYLFSFYLSGEGECDLSLSNLWDDVYVREFSNPIIIDGDEYIENDDWKSHLKFTSVGYHYISFYANTSGTSQIDFEFNTNNNIIFYKPLFVACNPKANINWFANNEDIFTTNEQFGIAFKGVTYNSSTKNIEFTCVDNTKKLLDATDFVKDGMVSSVAIEDGNLVITFNTDSGKEAIIIPLTDIFNPANYYTKVQTDDFLGNKVDKEQGKGLSTNDYTNNDKNKLNALPTNNALTTILNGKVNTDDLNKYVPKTDDDGHGNQSIYSPAGITMFAADEHGIVNSTGTFGAGGWYVSSPQGTFQTSANTIYRGTMGIDEDSAVWEKTATQQIPAATTEKNGLMSASDKKKLDDMKGVSTAADVSYDNTKTGLTATNVQDAIDEMVDTNLYETVVLTVGSADSSFNPVGQTITVTLEDGSATQYEVLESRQITFIVQRGMRYTISGTSTDDYRVLPLSVKAAIPTRYLTMRYIPIATGVFILQRDGNYYLREEYDAETMAEDAVGVLVLTSELIKAGFGIILSKSDANELVSMRAGNIILTTKDYTHYVGKSNTNTIYSQYPNNTFPIINKAIAKSITYGEEHTEFGYVASYAEGALLLSNATEINNCLILIGGVGIIANTWSSSFITTTGRCLKNWSNVALNYEQQTSSAMNRPIYQYPLS